MAADKSDAGKFADEYEASAASQFRFKSKRKRTTAQDDLEADSHRKKSRSEDHDEQGHHHHRRSKRPYQKFPHTPPDDPMLYDDTYLPNSRSSAFLDPNTAFRESLFDALADDEGAAFWEGVYGQPIHTYSSVKKGPEGELERMTDDEYTAYVRARMYEKTHQHIIEERERREENSRRRKKARDETDRMEGERKGFEQEIEESLRRGEQRKHRARWSARWDTYLRAWEKLKDEDDDRESQQRKKANVRDLIPWPVESGQFTDLNKDSIETFFRQALVPGTVTHARDQILLGQLKIERVRWHPDKVQQRFGAGNGGRLEERTMRAVTAVFQTVDQMWSEERAKRTA